MLAIDYSVRTPGDFKGATGIAMPAKLRHHTTPYAVKPRNDWKEAGREPMDLGINANHALVFCASKGLGEGGAMALAADFAADAGRPWQPVPNPTSSSTMLEASMRTPIALVKAASNGMITCVTGQNFLIDGGSCPGTL
jgi:hypothetical protein